MRKPRKKTAFVPSVVFGTVVLGVVPACAVSCGGTTASSTGDASTDARGVADAFGVADVSFQGVGACAFCDAAGDDAAGDGRADAPSDGPADAPADVPIPPGVAAVAFCGFCDAGDASDG